MKRIIAIDPGKSGGIIFTQDGLFAIDEPMPETDGDVVEMLDTAIANGCREAWVEQVGGYCGGKGAPGSAMFNFGQGYGFILGVLAARFVRVNLVRPQQWQKHFSLGTAKSCASKSEWKNKLKQKAQQLFPTHSVTLKTADAFLLYEYAQRQP